ncbi:MAG: hypothetical protein ABIH87_04510 [bacterium]
MKKIGREKINMKKTAPKKAEPELKLVIKQENPQTKKLMWFSVAIFMIAIISLWAWATKLKFSDLNLEKTPENLLLNRTQEEWDKIFNQTKEEQDRKATSEKLKDQVDKLLSNLEKISKQTTATDTGTSTDASTATTTFTDNHTTASTTASTTMLTATSSLLQ